MIALESLLKHYPQELRGFKRNILAEYLQCRVLGYLYSGAEGAKMIFIGGTAIRLCHESLRFSEDLDFDNTGATKEGFTRSLKEISRKLSLEGYDNEADFSFKGAFRCFLRFNSIYFRYGLSGHENEKLLLQIDAEPQGVKYESETRVINRFGVFARVVVPAPPVLLSMKIAALLGRRREKGRDFYDVTFLSAFTEPDYKYLKLRTGISGVEELKEALLRKTAGLNMKRIAADVSPFLFTKSDEQRVVYFEEFVKGLRFKL
ncbi:MAG TPA: nucleotidyl transferase AbiEii/AbiGii toxin family protein [bacterium]|nr:nucleotidyl transferase AbiEii/AbiGii toxin family protein [bacterium]